MVGKGGIGIKLSIIFFFNTLDLMHNLAWSDVGECLFSEENRSWNL